MLGRQTPPAAKLLFGDVTTGRIFGSALSTFNQQLKLIFLYTKIRQRICRRMCPKGEQGGVREFLVCVPELGPGS